ncbi:MAG: hypothetical protein EB167_05055 [Nitrososphaeria archaeon]|nr:hypothetical protein [Nitrososphaeria archaeon]
MQKSISKTLEKIQFAIEKGYKKILLSAPTGTGKSWIAIALSLYLRSATILTSTVLLQDQYRNEFGFFNTVRGKKRFLCEQTNKVFDCTHGYCNDCTFKPEPELYNILKKGTIAEKIIGQDMPRKCGKFCCIFLCIISFAFAIRRGNAAKKAPSL